MSETRKRKKDTKARHVDTTEHNPIARTPTPGYTFKERSRSSFRGVSSLKIFSKAVIIFATLIVVYFHSKDSKDKPLAKQLEFIEGRGQIIDCDQSFIQEIRRFDGCVPKQCKRVVTDKVITKLEAGALLTVAKKGLALGGSSGGASILNLHSGALSMGQRFVNLYKLKEGEKLFADSDFMIYNSVKEKAKHAVAQAFNIEHDKIYLADPTFFSEITSKEAVTIHDEYWHPHVDKETYKAFHYTTLLYLGDYGQDFEGGRFIFIDDKLNRTIEPRIGRLNMFTSGKENPHYVEKVTSGVRYALTIAFTCDKRNAITEPGTLY